jgi:hypothetical protein
VVIEHVDDQPGVVSLGDRTDIFNRLDLGIDQQEQERRDHEDAQDDDAQPSGV